jgi:hypothetical protein
MPSPACSACRDYSSPLELQKTGPLSIPLLKSRRMGKLLRSIGRARATSFADARAADSVFNVISE